MPPRHTPPGRHPLTRARFSPLGLEALEDRTALSLSTPSPVVDLGGLSLTPRFDQDHILVRFQPGQQPVALAGTTLGPAVKGVSGLYKVQLQANTTVTQAVDAYRRDARVQLAEPDYHLASAALSNDARLADQWALDNTGRNGGLAGADLDIAAAWRVTTGSTRTVVSVMDSGIDYTHPDLYLNIWINQGEIPASRRANLRDVDGDGLITFRDLNNPINQGPGKITDLNGNGRIDAGDLIAPMIKDSSGRDTGRGGWADRVSNDGDGYVDDICGWNYVNGNNDVMDDLGHGTHVAGILGAIGNNGVGVAGINWAIQMMPIRFMNASGSGSVSAFIEGLEYAVRKGARISNNSWTGANYSTALEEAIKSARDHGHIFVAAAGNYNRNNDLVPTYPASFQVDNVVSVTATDRSDRLASFANYGSRSVTLAAPGVDILSTTLGGGYGYNSGTSMATPHATGVLALVWTAHPNWTYTQVIQQVTRTVDRVSALAGKAVTAGRLNAGAAIGVAEIASTSPPQIISSVPSGPSANAVNRVRVTFDRAVVPSTFQPADVQLTGPSGQGIAVSAVTVVSGSGDRTYDITFATQTASGTYNLRIGPEVMDLRNVKMVIWSGSFQITSPPQIVSSVPSGPSANAVNRVRVTFDRAVVPSTFQPADVQLTGPSGQGIAVWGVQVVSGSGDRTFDITFATQTAPGTYNLRIGPEVMDLRNVKMVIWSGSFQVTAPAPAPTPPQIVSSVPSGPSANAVNRVRVTFDRAMALSSFQPADVRLTNPQGQVISVWGVQVVSGSGDRTFDITFPTQTAPGTYNLRIGPEVMDLRNVKMAVWTGSFQVNASAPVAAAKTYTSTVRTNVTPNGRGVSLLTISDNITIADLDVKVNISHPRVSDLLIHLQAPNGMDLVLFNRMGGETANLINTIFDDQAALAITSGRSPFTGSFQPAVPLKNFAGISAKGTWKLWVEDRGGVNSGALTSWSLIVRPRA